ncbi:hypothetical protein [Butyrivibrio sp. VCB2001]|uniref:hypothetical protein n=1 Tax=Butyrivibrio sp. VCB2001 TaxID=1280667 RepID=UPI0003FBE7DF|nr:hypothetical protein [Butyrivibrio sp. VCB2001]
MIDLKELKAVLSDELEESFRRGNINNMPRIPMMIVYADTDAIEAKKEIDTILQHSWGNRKNDIVQICMDGNSFLDADSNESLSEDDVQERIDNMYTADNTFREMDNICVVMLHSTTSCESIDQFKERFESISIFKDLISDGILTTSILFLDESTKCKKIASEIRAFLADMLANDSRPYKSTFLLSNRLSNGSLLGGKRMLENYSMAGWIMVLLNGTGAGYAPDMDLFYPPGEGCYLTAAFSEINRPNDSICDIVLHSILKWIDKQSANKGSTSAATLSFDDLCDALGVENGKAEFLESFFRDEISEKIPTAADIRFLPRQHLGGFDLAAQSFSSVDAETLGSCGTFISSLDLFDNELKEELKDYVQKFVKQHLSTAAVSNVFTVSNVQELVRNLRPVEPEGKEKIDFYIYEKIHADFVNWALPICEEEFRSLQKKSVTSTKEFENILQDFQQGYYRDDEDLEKYYSEITKDALQSASSGLGDRLLESIGSNGNERSEILDSLKKAAEEIFSAKAVFRMPLEQEMVSRMGQNPDDIHKQITNTLYTDLDKKIRLKTSLSLNPKKQITIVNKKDSDGNETELFRSIKQNVSENSNNVFFDSSNNNTIKILQFYECQQSNLT